jgi:carbohydrate-binding DOMON domain-containing protein
MARRVASKSAGRPDPSPDHQLDRRNILSDREAYRLATKRAISTAASMRLARNGFNGRDRYDVERRIAASSSASSATPTTATATPTATTATATMATTAMTATATAATTATKTIAGRYPTNLWVVDPGKA